MKAEIQCCIDQAVGGSNMVKNAQLIMEKLRKLGLLQKMQLHPKMVGIHPRNRDGAGPFGRHPPPWLCEVEGAGGGNRDRG